jgi:probable phosphoglycerate mutase
LSHLHFGELITSDLGRAAETAAIIAGFTGHRIQTDRRLRERNYGILEGMTLPEIKIRQPLVLHRLLINGPDYVVPKGECLRKHYQRCAAFLETYLVQKPGTTAVLVTHGGVLENFLRFVAQIPLGQPRSFVTANAALSVITHGNFYGSLRWVFETWGDVAHLNETGYYRQAVLC